MNDHTDSQLLRAFAEHRSEPAFAELVRRHVDLVHSAAQRMVRDSHLAQDVTQGVFVVLANNAAQLAAYPVLSGWLHRTAQNIAAQVVRTDVRRRAREQEAAAMNELLADTPDAPWEHIALHLDAALGELADADRDAVLLRYFERKSAREMAGMLGISDEAAQKRVNRSVERLREIFARRGVSVGAGALAVVITTNAVQAAPVGMAVAISAVALAGTTFTTATQTIAMTTLQKTLVAATLAAAVGVGIYEARQASQLRAQISVDRARRTTLPAPNDAAFAALQQKAEQLAAQNAELSNALTQASADKTRLETAYQQSKRSTALFQELAAQAAAKDTNPTNAYPTVRHAWAGIGKLGRASASWGGCRPNQNRTTAAFQPRKKPPSRPRSRISLRSFRRF